MFETQKLMIDEKKCYFFGRNKQLCDFCIDHASSSRVHAALIWHKHLNRPFIIDLGSSEFCSALLLPRSNYLVFQQCVNDSRLPCASWLHTSNLKFKHLSGKSAMQISHSCPCLSLCICVCVTLCISLTSRNDQFLKKKINQY